MKKLVSIVALACGLCVSVFAQERENRDEQGNIVRGPYEANAKFMDNTFVELQGGVNLVAAYFMGQGIGGQSIKPALAMGVNVGKWIYPYFGVRLGWMGRYTSYMPGSTMVREKTKFNYTHADFMLNLSDLAYGYREDRVWDFVPYLHVGWINTPATGYPKALNKPGAGAGLLNLVRLSKRINLTLDLRATFCTNAIMGLNYVNPSIAARGRDTFMEKLGCIGTAQLGLQLQLGEIGWTRK